MGESENEIIFVIDDEDSVRKSITLFLTAHGFRVRPMVSAEEFLASERHTGPGCLLLDVNLEGKSGLELQTELLRTESHLPIIFISGKGNIPMSVETMKKGAVNFLEKPFAEETLLKSISEAIELSETLRHEQEDISRCQILMDSLTPREFEILTLVVTGMLNKQIAGELNIAEHTVKLHRHSICEKLGVKSVPEIIHIAEKSGRILQ